VSYRNLNFCDNKSRFYDRIHKGRARKVEGEASKLAAFFKAVVLSRQLRYKGRVARMGEIKALTTF
jgi:hypothetical protein